MKPLNQYPKHKRKKIEYIRTKFLIKRGLYQLCSLVRITNELKDDVQEMKVIIDSNIIFNTAFLKRKWKLDFEALKFTAGQTHDDFLQNMTSIRIEFKAI